MSIQQPGQGTAAAEATEGAGHFVKMVHNGIEYADMQFIGEAYELLKAARMATPRCVASGGVPCCNSRSASTWLRGGTRLVRLHPGATRQRCPHPRTARFLRRTHLSAHRRGRYRPHPLVWRPQRDPG